MCALFSSSLFNCVLRAVERLSWGSHCGGGGNEALLIMDASALPILRELGAQNSGGNLINSVREGDFSMLKVWVGLEARRYFLASVEDVSSLILVSTYSRTSDLCSVHNPDA